MIVNFYHTTPNSRKFTKLIAFRNIECIPQKGTFIEFSGQTFIVDKVIFNIDKSKYAVCMCRV